MNFHTIYKNHSKKQLFPDERLQDLKSNKIFTAALHQNGSVSIIDANGETKNYFAENNSPIVQMSIGSFAHLLLLTQDQRVYSYFTNNSSFQGGNENKKTLSNGLYEIESLRNKKITQVLATQISSYCLSEDQDKSLYWWGYHPLRTSTGRPQIIAKNVDRIFGGCSWHMFFTKTDGSLYGDGYNTSSQLGNNINTSSKDSSKIDIPINVEDIEDIALTQNSSMILSSEHKVYIAGSVNVQIKKFQLFDFFTDKDPIAISGSQTSILVLTSDEKLYCVPKFHSTTNLEGEITKVTNITSQRQQLQQLHLTLKLEQKISSIFFDYHTNILLCFGTDPLNIDFSLLYKSNQHFADQKIFDIPVHSSVLKMRLNYDLNDGFETIKNNIEKNFTKEETLKLLDWIYEEINIRNLETCEKIKSQFNIDNLLEKTIKQDLIHLYKNEESKDFSLLVKDYDEEDNDDEEGEEEEEEEENYEEIPVHKFILIARSGLFREMFKNISENVKNLNSIRDYSRKSVESIEILIKYFYTDKIELTADDDPALIVEELSDAVEYYQLNPNSTITHELNSIRKQFNLD